MTQMPMPIPQRHARRLAAAADRRNNHSMTGKTGAERTTPARTTVTTTTTRRRIRRRRDHGCSSSTTKLTLLFVFVISCGLTYRNLGEMKSFLNNVGMEEEDLHYSYFIMPRPPLRRLESNSTALTINASSSTSDFVSSYIWNYLSHKEPTTKDDAKPNTYNTAIRWNTTNNNNTTTIIPHWLQEYFAWHHAQKQQLTAANWNTEGRRYLVMTCFRGHKCGGITDRLRPVLALLRAAHVTNRILLIYWERPFALEEFLVPPPGRGLDWTVPSFMVPALQQSHQDMAPSGYWRGILTNAKDSRTIFTTQYQSWHYGWQWYDEQRQQQSDAEPPAIEVFRHVWNALFVPSPPVQALIDDTKQTLGLIPGEFATAHIRALWSMEERPSDEIPVLVQNAMNCASNMRPGGPFLVTSDHLECLEEAKRYGAEKGVHVMTPSYDNKEPLHVGLHNENDTSVTPQDFYSAFRDIYLISMSRCVTYGPGGYGSWGQVLGYDHTCWSRHAGERSRTCIWTDKELESSLNNNSSSSKTTTAPAPKPSPCMVNETLPCVLNTTVQQETKLVYNPQIHLWDQDNATMIPDWLKQYFQWHKQTRAKLTPDNYQQYRYMVMTCRRGTKCGGMTDRLRPVLTHLRVAYNSSRLFFIHWERPFPLEEYLLPPEGGFDWRLPPFLIPGVKDTQVVGQLSMRFFGKTEPTFVTPQYQSWHYGELIYDEALLPGEADSKTVFRDVWNILFTPSPPVAKMVYHSFEKMGITPGHYTTAHIRALYNLDDRGPREMKMMVHNAMNCASNLRPGGPFFVAADSEKAVDMALEYGKSKNVKVVATPHKKQPLHLGLHNESDTSVVPADFYDIFADMYLIAETNCMVVGPGGFGRWGILLGHNRTCNKYSSGFKAERCNWKDPPLSAASQIHPSEAEKFIPQFRQPMEKFYRVVF